MPHQRCMPLRRPHGSSHPARSGLLAVDAHGQARPKGRTNTSAPPLLPHTGGHTNEASAGSDGNSRLRPRLVRQQPAFPDRVLVDGWLLRLSRWPGPTRRGPSTAPPLHSRGRSRLRLSVLSCHRLRRVCPAHRQHQLPGARQPARPVVLRGALRPQAAREHVRLGSGHSAGLADPRARAQPEGWWNPAQATRALTTSLPRVQQRTSLGADAAVRHCCGLPDFARPAYPSRHRKEPP